MCMWGGVRGVVHAVNQQQMLRQSLYLIGPLFPVKLKSKVQEMGSMGEGRAVNHLTLYARSFRLYILGEEYPQFSTKSQIYI